MQGSEVLVRARFSFVQAREKTQISTESGCLSRLYLDGRVLSKPDLLFRLANNTPNTPVENISLSSWKITRLQK